MDIESKSVANCVVCDVSSPSISKLQHCSRSIALRSAATYKSSLEDVKTIKCMLGHGIEFWQYRNGKLILWKAALNSGKGVLITQ
jgi:hypothetical protein